MSQKAYELAQELFDELKIRCPEYTNQVLSFDSNGNPTIELDNGSPATTQDNVFIRVEPRDWTLSKDVLGLAANVYTPSTIQLAVEGPPSGLGLGRYVSIAHLFAIITSIAERGALFQYWEETNGTVPTVTTFATASKLKTSHESLYFPLISSQ
jgi:hypothetical protein